MRFRQRRNRQRASTDMSTRNPPSLKTVLVVENELDLQEMIQTVLEELDLVACASDGQESARLSRQHDGAVPTHLLHFHMPNTGRLRVSWAPTQGRASSPRSSALHGRRSTTSRRSATSSRADSIKKPFDCVELLAAVREYVT